MANYWQSCATLGCNYTGFSGHSPWCPWGAGYKSREHWLDSKFTYVLTSAGHSFSECNRCGAVVRNIKRERHMNSHEGY